MSNVSKKRSAVKRSISKKSRNSKSIKKKSIPRNTPKKSVAKRMWQAMGWSTLPAQAINAQAQRDITHLQSRIRELETAQKVLQDTVPVTKNVYVDILASGHLERRIKRYPRVKEATLRALSIAEDSTMRLAAAIKEGKIAQEQMTVEEMVQSVVLATYEDTNQWNEVERRLYEIAFDFDKSPREVFQMFYSPEVA